MKPTVNVSSTDAIAKLKASLAALAKKRVLVGIPEDANARKDEMTNAGLMYLHTNGSALQGIPARPVIEPTISAPDNKANIAKALGEAGRAVLAKNAGEATHQLDRAGTLATNAAKRWFTDSRNGWAENAASTVRRKGSSRPLIDTGQLRRAITHTVEDK